MSSIGNLGGSMNDLLAALRQQLLGNTDPNAALGQIDPDGGNDGGGGSQTPATIAVTAAPPLTGTGTGNFDSTLLNLMLNLQEQPDASGTSGAPAAPKLTPHEQQLFAKLDTNGDGTISKTELEAAVTAAGGDNATADALFAKLDSNGDGSISSSEFAAAAPQHHHGGGGMGKAGGSGGEGGMAQALTAAAAGDTTNTVNNPDGSTTTTITYADGTSLVLTTPAPHGQGGDGASPDATGNAAANGTGPSPSSPESLMEKRIKLEAEMIQAFGDVTPPGA